MGRAKLKMELIDKEKSRILTLKKRKEGLTKKLHQLTTLCDVPACMIVYDPNTNYSEIWPQDSGKVSRLIHAYNSNPGGVRSYGLPDFFNDRQKQIEDQLLKLRKKNLEAKYPTWDDDYLCFMDESQLRGLAAALRAKAEAVRSRIQFLKSPAAAYMDVMSSVAQLPVPNYYYAELPVSVPNYYFAPPPLPLAPQPYMNMDDNLNYYFLH